MDFGCSGYESFEICKHVCFQFEMALVGSKCLRCSSSIWSKFNTEVIGQRSAKRASGLTVVYFPPGSPTIHFIGETLPGVDRDPSPFSFLSAGQHSAQLRLDCTEGPFYIND